MDYITQVFERMELSEIRHFFMYGTEDSDAKTRSYKEKLKQESNSIYSRLRRIYPIEENYEEATADLAKALTAYEEVYMEIGMKAGARIIFQLLHINDPLLLNEKETQMN